MTQAAQLRQDGNEFFKVAMEANMNLKVKESLLEKSLQCYTESVKESTSLNERSSAAKNAGKAAWQLALTEKDLEKSAKSIQKTFRLAFLSLNKAEGCGDSKDASWIKGLQNSQTQCFNDIIRCAIDIAKGCERAAFLEGFLDVVSCNIMKAKCFIAIAKALFNSSVDMLQEGDFKSALSLLHNCHYPVEEASRVARDDLAIQSEVGELRQDVTTSLSIAESFQAIKMGDDVLAMAVMDTDELNIDMVWAAIDWYRKALIMTRGREVECEAKARSRLGHVYYDVLKLNERAKANFMQCMELSLSLYPRSPESEEWYKVCKRALDKMQQDMQLEEDRNYQKKREGFVKELEKELKELSSINEKNKTKLMVMLQMIYKKFPLADKEKQMLYKNEKKWNDDQTKKAFQMAVLHYHPDKVDMATAGMKLKVLHEEITKVLNKYYTEIKDAMLV